MPTKFSTAPFYDDFDPTKDFYRILFRPGTAVQARELTQLQTIINNQTEQFANHIFQNGAMVIPGQIAYDLEYSYVKVKSTISGNPINLASIDPDDDSNAGQEIFIEGTSSGVKAKVLKIVAPENSDPYTIFVKYVNSGTDGSDKTFRQGSITDVPAVEAEFIRKFGTANNLAQIQDSDQSPIGNGSAAIIEEGIYYIKGVFARVQKQSIILEKYSSTPTYRIGLEVLESVVTPSEDDSLNDNAQGSPNFAAPGAHRYKLELSLVKRSIDTSVNENNEDFVELLRLRSGIRELQIRETDYSLIEDTLARRTYDESGDYYLKPFGIDIREHYNTGSNRGVFDLTNGGDIAKLAVGIEPSKAYVKGYEIQTIATTWVAVDKGRDTAIVNNGSIRANLGNWLYVTDVFNFPSIDNYQKINLYSVLAPGGADPGSGNIIGTANVRGFELIIGTAGSSGAIYKMYLFNIQMNTGVDFNSVMGYYAAGSPSVSGNVCVENTLIGPARGALSSGEEIRSKDGTAREEIVYWDESTGSLITKASTTYPRIALNDTIDYYESSVLTTEDSAKIVNKIYLHDTGNNGLIFNIPKSAIKTVKGQSNVIDTTYTIKRVFNVAITDNSSPSGAGKIIINLGANEEFGSFNTIDYVLTVTSGGSAGTIVNLATATISIGVGTLEISGLNAYQGLNVKLIAPVTKQIAIQKSKVLKTETATKAYVVGQPITLDRIDIFKINYIKDNGVTDITEQFYLDNGQRDTHYQRGELYLKDGASGPEFLSLTIEYQYFEHGSGGDYFSVDSYNPVQVAYEDIPAYISSDTKQIYFLSDCLDFRPRTNDIDDDFPSLGQSEIIQPNDSIRADYQYYLNRIDKVYLDKDGKFRVIKGVAADYPQPPEDPKDGMVLYVISIPAYTFSPTDVKVKQIDNRRYTMRDIGKLEKRIENLEYYTTLSLLEKETSDLSIPDAATGLDRFKNGFICDSFVGHGIGDVYDGDYRCSIDSKNGEMRPFFKQEYVDLEFQEVDPDNGNAAVSSNYTKTGDLVTLPYTEVDFLTQPFSSKKVNVNPYNVFNWVGTLKLSPETDTWRDTERRPDISIQDNTLFDAMRNMLENTGVLGTVWSEWQTNWAGETVSSRETENIPAVPRQITQEIINQRSIQNGVVVSTNTLAGLRTVINPGDEGRRTVETTTTTRQGQSRTAVTTTVVPGAVRSTIDDRVLQVGLVPFMRSRDVYFEGTRFKPNTRLYPFFDGVDVSRYASGSGGSGYGVIAPTVSFTGGGGSGASATATIRNGKIVFISMTSGGSGYTSAPTVSFGAVSGATAPSSTDVDCVVENGQVIHCFVKIKTDDNGACQGIFRIPNSDLVRFRVGLRVFRLCDDTQNRNNLMTTWGDTNYQASGLLETRQSTITSTREPQVVRTVAGENRVITSSVVSSRTFSSEIPTNVTSVVVNQDLEVGPPELAWDQINWVDPLAQTFLATEPGGIFLTSVDLYFASKDSSIPVTIQLRNTVNGYPGQKIVPFSEVTLNPSDVIVDPDGTRNLATTFTFDSPVYLPENVEFCLVIISNSDNYEVWVARMGEDQIGTTTPISKQPYAGVLFKSQNASTWTAEQYEDLKVTLKRASFDTSVFADLYFVNEALDTKELPAFSLQTKNGSDLVRVYHPQHGMPYVAGTSSKVTMAGVTGTTLNGIPIAEFNATHEILNVTQDTYMIRVTTPATASGTVGNEGITVTRNIQMDLCHPIVQTVILPNTVGVWRVKTTSGNTVGGSITPYVKATDWQNVVINEDFVFTSPKLIASQINETDLVQAGVGVYNNKSFILNARLASGRENISPVIDLQRTGVIAIGNRCNTETHLTNNVSEDSFDSSVVSGSAMNIVFSATDNSLTAPSAVFNINDIGKYIVVTTTGSNINLAPSFNSANKIIDVPSPTKIIVDASVVTQGSTSTTIEMYNFFKSEEAPFNSSGISKYITRPLTVQDPANAIRIFSTAFRELESDFDVYYRVGRTTDSRLFQDIPYTKLPLSQVPQNNLGTFTEYTYGIDDIEPFTTFALKIVPKTTNSTRVPRFRDIRGIVLST